MSVAPAESHLQSGMQLSQCGLLRNPQPSSHRRGQAANPHAQLHRTDFTVVDYAQNLTSGFASGKYSRQHPEWTALHNPVKGVKRPSPQTTEGKTPALGDHQARLLLDAPVGDGLKAKRGRAMLATLLYHGLRRDELPKLRVKEYRQERRDMVMTRPVPPSGPCTQIGMAPAKKL